MDIYWYNSSILSLRSKFLNYDVFMSLKFVFILASFYQYGLGGDSVTDGRTDRRGDWNIPIAFFKKRGN